MIEDMTVRNFVEKTRNDYIRHVRTFTAFLGRSPNTAMPESPRHRPTGPITAIRIDSS
jgi:integrase/recombinase XerD